MTTIYEEAAAKLFPSMTPKQESKPTAPTPAQKSDADLASKLYPEMAKPEQAQQQQTQQQAQPKPQNQQQPQQQQQQTTNEAQQTVTAEDFAKQVAVAADVPELANDEQAIAFAP